MPTNTNTTDTTTYLVMAPNYWGKGSTIEEAKRQLKLAGGTLVKYLVYRMPEGATEVYVDQMGTVRWTWAEGADRTQQAEIVAKRGVKA